MDTKILITNINIFLLLLILLHMFFLNNNKRHLVLLHEYSSRCKWNWFNLSYFCLQFYYFFINFVQHAEEKQLNNMPGDKYFSWTLSSLFRPFPCPHLWNVNKTDQEYLINLIFEFFAKGRILQRTTKLLLLTFFILIRSLFCKIIKQN